MKNVQFMHKKYRKNVQIIVKPSAIESRAERSNMILTDEDRLKIAKQLKAGVKREVIREEYGINDPTVIDKIRSGCESNPKYILVKWKDLNLSEREDLLSQIYFKKLSLNAVSNGWQIDPHSIKVEFQNYVNSINKVEQKEYYHQAMEAALTNLKSELQSKQRELETLNFKKTQVEASIYVIESTYKQIEKMFNERNKE